MKNQDKFKIVGSDIFITGKLDADSPDGMREWNLNVVALKGSQSPSSSVFNPDASYATIVIEVRDVNDNPPVFDVCCLSAFIDEDIRSGEY